MGLKDALSICAMFRGTYLDYKEKVDALNSKYMIQEKNVSSSDLFFPKSSFYCYLNRMDPSKMLIWHVNPYGEK
jgi:hypothetical protein